MTTPIAGARLRVQRGGAWRVDVDGVPTLAKVVVTSVGQPPIVEARVAVARWRPPVPGWIGSPRVSGLSGFDVRPDGSGVEVRLTSAEPVDPAVLLAGALRSLRPHPTGDAAPMLTFAPGVPAEAAPVADHLVDVLVEGESRDEHVRRADVLVVGSAGQSASVDRAATVVVTEDGWSVDGRDAGAWVDPAVHRPVGRRSQVDGELATAAVERDTTVVSWPGGSITVDRDLTPSDVRLLRAVKGVIAGAPVHPRLRAQLAACGVVVAADHSGLPGDGDGLAWQAASVVGRRTALREQSAPASILGWPSVTVVIATHRPEHIENALRQIAGFDYPSLQVVIGAHGRGVDAGALRWLAQHHPHDATVVEVDADRTLGEVLQACSDRADGSLVTKVDDDDTYGPQHIWDLVLARHYSGAQVVGKALDWIRVESEDVTVFRPTYAAEKYAPFVAGGTMLISRSDLAAVGGWRPVPKSVDRALLDRVLAYGGLVYRTHGLGYVYVRGSHGHTASVQDAHFLTKTVSTQSGLIEHSEFGTAQQR